MFWIGNDPPLPLPPLEVFRKFIRFGTLTRPLMYISLNITSSINTTNQINQIIRDGIFNSQPSSLVINQSDYDFCENFDLNSFSSN